MATINITAGAFSWEKSASNVKADRVFTSAAVALGYRGDVHDKQAVLEHVGQSIVDFLVQNAYSGEVNVRIQAAVADVDSDSPVLE